MPRMARVVVPGVTHHITQRGNRRQLSFFGPADYALYLRIAAEEFTAAEVEVWGYCLTPNHIHLIATPARADSLAAAVGATHLRYTRQINRRERWTGYLWQGRFASPLTQRLGPRLAAFFDLDVDEEAMRALRKASGTGRPLGAAAWVKALERSTGRQLAARPVGRPRAEETPVVASMLF